MVHILLADDHTMFRQGLRELIERNPAFRVVGEAATGSEALELVRRLQPDIAILDIEMPGVNGIEVAQNIKRFAPNVRIIMLTMFRRDEHLVAAVNAGVRGYLLKDADADELMAVLEKVARGEQALDPTLLREVDSARHRVAEQAALTRAFTPREREILQLLVAGYDNKTIAATLFIAEKTVGNRLSEIFSKLGATNRTQAAMLAIQYGIVVPNEA